MQIEIQKCGCILFILVLRSKSTLRAGEVDGFPEHASRVTIMTDVINFNFVNGPLFNGS